MVIYSRKEVNNVNYLVSYDLNKSGKDYDGVYKAIEKASSGTWCRPLESVWVIQSNLTTQAIYDVIAPHIDSNDRLLVIEVANSAAWCLDQKVSDYIKKML